jgi:hypothetical protein
MLAVAAVVVEACYKAAGQPILALLLSLLVLAAVVDLADRRLVQGQIVRSRRFW